MNEIKKKFTINIAIAVLLVAAFLYIGSEYLVRDIETYSSQIVQGEQSISMQDSKNAQLPELRKRYEEMMLMMETAFDSVVGKEDTVAFIEEAEKTAIRDKVKLDIKNQGATEEEETNNLLVTASFNFRVGGTFNNVMHFLGDMENFKYCSEIEDVHMSYEDFDRYNENMVILTFDVILYQENSQE
jgi:hypothetical protein